MTEPRKRKSVKKATPETSETPEFKIHNQSSRFKSPYFITTVVICLAFAYYNDIHRVKERKQAQPHANLYKLLIPGSKVNSKDLSSFISGVTTMLANEKSELDKCHFNHLLGKAWAIKADQNQSNEYLKKGIKYLKDVDPVICDEKLVKENANFLAEKCQFMGLHVASAAYLEKVRSEFHDEDLLLKLAVSYLYQGQNDKAVRPLLECLDVEPDHYLALVNLGWVETKLAEKAKADDKKISLYQKAIIHLDRGLKVPKSHKDFIEVNNARYWRQLADAYLRTDQRDHHDRINELAAENNIWPSAMQRSSYNAEGLTPRHYWTPSETGMEQYLKAMQQNFDIIRKETLNVFEKKLAVFSKEAESLSVQNGISDWRQLTFFERGRKNQQNCNLCPNICRLIERYGGEKVTKCKRGQTKLSVMLPGTEVWPHVGPSNTRIRAHLGIKVPEDFENLWIVVNREKRHWKENEWLIEGFFKMS